MSSGAVMKVHPVLCKFNPGVNAIGLNSRLAALSKSMFDRSMSVWKESVSPGMFSVMNVLDEKEFENAEEKFAILPQRRRSVKIAGQV